jgi:hypothetical protein
MPLVRVVTRSLSPDTNEMRLESQKPSSTQGFIRNPELDPVENDIST